MSFQTWEEETIESALRAGWDVAYPEEVISVPEHLWHYATAASLEGILKSRSMFATHFEYLNDPSEVTRFSDIARKVSKSRTDPSVTDETQITTADQFKAAMWDTVGRIKNINAYNAPFVVSMSADGDLLGQWRAYAGNCTGYAVGVSPKWLHERSLHSDHPFRLWRVVYDADAQERLVAGVIDTAIARMANAWSESDDDSSHQYVLRRGAHILWRLAAEMAPVLKHPAYEFEHEWRLVTLRTDPHQAIRHVQAGTTPTKDVIDSVDAELGDIMYRVSRDNFVPHVVLKMADEHNTHPFRRVRIGPLNNQRLQLAAVKHLVYRLGLHREVEVDCSDLPVAP